MSGEERLTPQAAYQRRRRAQQRPVVYFPRDRARLDQAIRESGLEAQAWVARAVEERIQNQARLQEKVEAAFHQFKTQCFWNVSPNQPLSTLARTVVRQLRKYGGMAGMKVAAELEELAPDDVRWR